MNYTKAQIERFLARPDPAITAVLFYGPDQGLAHERARTVIRLVLGADEDAFRFAELNAKEVTDDPARLMDELNAISMLGGRRVVRIGPAIDNRLNDTLAEAVSVALEHHTDPECALLVVEAGDLAQRHALVQAFVGSTMAIAARCFHDSEDDLRAFIAATLRQAGYEATRAALEYLADHLGDDRGITRSELQKLCLYVGMERKIIELADVLACIGDRSEIALDDLMLAIADGDPGSLLRCFERCLVDAAPIELLRAAGRYFLRLHYIVGGMQAGQSFDKAIEGLKPPVFWAIKAGVERHCRRWSAPGLAWALERLLDAEAEAMRFHDLGPAIARRAFLDIAALARQGARGAARRG